MTQDQEFHGAKEIAGLQSLPRSPYYEGRFGRLFRNLAPHEASDEALASLAGVMVEPEEDSGQAGWGRRAGQGQPDNANIPAGYTYLGQFVDHDITFDPASQLLRANDPDALKNFRSPRFDLDSVYASGPHDAAYLYESTGPFAGVHLLTGAIGDSEDEADLVRNAQGRAIIGDPRNDENLIVSQLQLAMIRFHNAVATRLAAEQGLAGSALFEEAQRQTRWHYQWVVVHDFLIRIVGGDVVNDILRPDADSYVVWAQEGEREVALPGIRTQFYKWKHYPYMPVEFSVAAYRFGHSMIRPSYELNGTTGPLSIFPDLQGFGPRDPGRSIEWNRLFEIDGSEPQLSRLINPELAPPLGQLPFASGSASDPASLAHRNLLRSKALRLPSGQAVAKAMNLPPDLVVAPEKTELTGDLEPLAHDTPLWFYVLKEAQVKAGGTKLGPVGGRIVAEVLLGLLKGDPHSYFQACPHWEPTLTIDGATVGPDFSMGHLLKVAMEA